MRIIIALILVCSIPAQVRIPGPGGAAAGGGGGGPDVWYYPGGLGESGFTSGPSGSGWAPQTFCYGNDIVVASAGTATKLAFRGFHQSGTGTFKIGLYDSGGNLIVQSTISSVTTTPTWWEATISQSISAGTYYVLLSSADADGRYYYNTTDTGKTASVNYASSMASTVSISDEANLGYAVRIYVD